jgi:hypothetical protein
VRIFSHSGGTPADAAGAKPRPTKTIARLMKTVTALELPRLVIAESLPHGSSGEEPFCSKFSERKDAPAVRWLSRTVSEVPDLRSPCCSGGSARCFR